MLELVEQTIDEVIQVMGRATIEAVLEMSVSGSSVSPASGPEGACGAATAQAPGRRGGWRGRGAGVRSDAETGRRGGMLDGGERKYGRVIGEMADTVGVSSAPWTVEASERVLKELMERRLDAWDGDLPGRDPDGLAPRACCDRRGLRRKEARAGREGRSGARSRIWSSARRLFALARRGREGFGQPPHPALPHHKLRNVLGHLPKGRILR